MFLCEEQNNVLLNVQSFYIVQFYSCILQLHAVLVRVDGLLGTDYIILYYIYATHGSTTTEVRL